MSPKRHADVTACVHRASDALIGSVGRIARTVCINTAEETVVGEEEVQHGEVQHGEVQHGEERHSCSGSNYPCGHLPALVDAAPT